MGITSDCDGNPLLYWRCKKLQKRMFFPSPFSWNPKTDPLIALLGISFISSKTQTCARCMRNGSLLCRGICNWFEGSEAISSRSPFEAGLHRKEANEGIVSRLREN